jgi:hypothetical protein
MSGMVVVVSKAPPTITVREGLRAEPLAQPTRHAKGREKRARAWKGAEAVPAMMSIRGVSSFRVRRCL